MTHATKHILSSIQNEDCSVGPREERQLGEIAAEHSPSPNIVRNWKREFLENAETVFENPKKLERQAKRKEAALEIKNTQMLKTIGRLMLERDSLQDCFRRTGQEIPKLDSEES